MSGNTAFFLLRHTLVLCLCLAPGTVLSTTDCNSTQAGAPRVPSAFEQYIRDPEHSHLLKQAIRTSLCTRDNIFAFLTGEPEHRYGTCFIPARQAESFWDADHKTSESLLAAFRRDCISWAEQRYQARIARIETNARRQAEQQRRAMLRRKAEQQRVLAMTRARQQAQHADKLASSHRRAVQEALQSLQGDTRGFGLQWFPAAASEQDTNPELAAFLLATDLQLKASNPPPAEHARLHLNNLLGEPRITAVNTTGTKNEYRVQIRSTHPGLVIEAFVRSSLPPAVDATPWVLFTYREGRLVPVAAVLQTPQQVLTAERVSGGELQLKTLPEKHTEHLAADGGPVQVRLQCMPQGGGDPMPLRNCLKPDGEISILSRTHHAEHSYDNLQRRQREYRTTLNAPFSLLARTGRSNRLGALEVRIVTTTGKDTAEVFNSRAVARRDSLFVYSE